MQRLPGKTSFLLAAMAMTLPTKQTAAADLPNLLPVVEAIELITVEAPVMDWTGFYAGAIAGWGVSRNRAEVTGNSAFQSFYPDLTLPASLPINQRSFTTGLTAGHNWQFNRFIVGVEADAAYLGFDASSLYFSPPSELFDQFRTEASQRIDFFSTVRGRVGVQISERAMLFGTGGLAIGRIDYKAQIVDVSSGFISNLASWDGREKALKLGWAAGAGGEYKFTENVSVKLEGLYYSLADSKATAIGNDFVQNDPFLSQFTIDSKRKNNGVIARAGLNYRF